MTPSEISNQLPVDDVWDIGRRLAEKLRRIGQELPGSLSRVTMVFLRKQFNVCVARTAMELRGGLRLWDPTVLMNQAKVSAVLVHSDIP